MPKILIPIKTISEANWRGHWSQKARRAKDQRAAVYLALKPHTPPSLPCTVTLTRLSPGTLDGDNLQSALKATRDEVARWLGVDDGSDLVRWEYAQQKAKGYAVVVWAREETSRAWRLLDLAFDAKRQGFERLAERLAELAVVEAKKERVTNGR